jgi:hypothetical protein
MKIKGPCQENCSGSISGDKKITDAPLSTWPLAKEPASVPASSPEPIRDPPSAVLHSPLDTGTQPVLVCTDTRHMNPSRQILLNRSVKLYHGCTEMCIGCQPDGFIQFLGYAVLNLMFACINGIQSEINV